MLPQGSQPSLAAPNAPFELPNSSYFFFRGFNAPSERPDTPCESLMLNQSSQITCQEMTENSN